VRVVRLANYVAPASGGLRTALAELGAGCLAAGQKLARQHAERFGWPTAVNGFLGAHELTPLPRGGEGTPAVRVGT
jgi:hypothetical protein